MQKVFFITFFIIFDGSVPKVTWDGTKGFGSVILICTPNADLVLAFEKLLKGYKVSPPLPF
jgi:hypothetical protein